MIYILTIGFHQFAFENSRGLDTVIRTLDNGMPLKRSFLEYEGQDKWQKAKEPIEVKLETDSTVSITKGKGRASWQPERVVVTPEVIREQRDTPRQIAGPKCLPSFRNKTISQ